jgi:predicted patatin/cPLA2 family phospholipase
MMYDTVTEIGLTAGGSSTVQYTFTHKQYAEQHIETEYPERKEYINITRRIHNLQN